MPNIQVDSDCLGRKLQIHAQIIGQGPPLLLLHGYPQTHRLWNQVAPELAKHYTVVMTDLRGYGDSDKPKGSESHVEYSKKEMAADQAQVMSSLGFDTFYLVGHDRGARVAHRLALDYPKAVKKLMVLDILPTLYSYKNSNFTFANGYWHWFFLIQAAPTPEKMINESPEGYWEMKMGASQPAYWTKDDRDVYKAFLYNPDAVHSSCEDYRAGASIDMEHDEADLSAGKRLAMPVRAIWAKQGMIEKMGDALGVWRQYSSVDVSGRAVDCGHYIPEEKPRELIEEILAFMK